MSSSCFPFCSSVSGVLGFILVFQNSSSSWACIICLLQGWFLMWVCHCLRQLWQSQAMSPKAIWTSVHSGLVIWVWYSMFPAPQRSQGLGMIVGSWLYSFMCFFFGCCELFFVHTCVFGFLFFWGG